MAARAGLAASLLLHGAVVALLLWVPPLPALDFELELPAEVEFGVAQPAASELPAETTPTTTEPPATPPPEPEPAVAKAPEPGDAPAEPKPEPKPKPPKPTPPETPSGPLLAAYAPKGTQLNLRVDLELVRASPLSEDVRPLLKDAPDVRAVLDGSGIDPLRDLERLYLASPDLRRENVVMAGRYASDLELPRKAVAALASASAQNAKWKQRDGIEVAPWHDVDATERSVALIGPRAFVITRTKDLARVLAVARATPRISEPPAAAVPQPQAPDAPPAPDEPAARDPLLDLDPGIAAVLSVYDARRFARGNTRGIPLQLELQARIREDGGVIVDVFGAFENPDAAQSAVEYWTRLRERFAAHPLVALVGMRGPLVSTTIAADQQRVLAHAELSQQQARTLLGFVRSSIAPPPPPPRRTPDTPAPVPAPASPPPPEAAPSR